ncbi:MAG TPA: family 16 glycoside hydrolase, partial [Urbifossiella sp.]|nr:family 16 glycoside hydrolase [Urbifossiella sp.]
YRVRMEYKWGTKTDGGKYVRNSGLLLHGTGPDGAANGTWMASVEVQLAQGCAGDLIPIRGAGADGKTIAVSLASDVTLGPDKRPRWTPGGTKTVFTGRQLWWKDHDPTFQELLDTRGKNDRESPLGEWTAVECACDRDTITVSINGTVVNRAYEVNPSAGKILLQCEGFELFVRNFEISPLSK